MANEANISIGVKDKTARGSASVISAFKRISKEAKTTSKQTGRLGSAFQSASSKMRGLTSGLVGKMGVVGAFAAVGAAAAKAANRPQIAPLRRLRLCCATTAAAGIATAGVRRQRPLLLLRMSMTLLMRTTMTTTTPVRSFRAI